MSKYEEAVKAGMTDEDIISLFQPKMTTALTQMGENDTKAFLGTQMGLPENLVSSLMGAKATPSSPPEDLSPEAKAAPVMPTTEAPEPSLLDQATSAVKDMGNTVTSMYETAKPGLEQVVGAVAGAAGEALNLASKATRFVTGQDVEGKPGAGEPLVEMSNKMEAKWKAQYGDKFNFPKLLADVSAGLGLPGMTAEKSLTAMGTLKNLINPQNMKSVATSVALTDFQLRRDEVENPELWAAGFGTLQAVIPVGSSFVGYRTAKGTENYIKNVLGIKPEDVARELATISKYQDLSGLSELEKQVLVIGKINPQAAAALQKVIISSDNYASHVYKQMQEKTNSIVNITEAETGSLGMTVGDTSAQIKGQYGQMSDLISDKTTGMAFNASKVQASLGNIVDDVKANLVGNDKALSTVNKIHKSEPTTYDELAELTSDLGKRIRQMPEGDTSRLALESVYKGLRNSIEEQVGRYATVEGKAVISETIKGQNESYAFLKQELEKEGMFKNLLFSNMPQEQASKQIIKAVTSNSNPELTQQFMTILDRVKQTTSPELVEQSIIKNIIEGSKRKVSDAGDALVDFAQLSKTLDTLPEGLITSPQAKLVMESLQEIASFSKQDLTLAKSINKFGGVEAQKLSGEVSSILGFSAGLKMQQFLAKAGLRLINDASAYAVTVGKVLDKDKELPVIIGQFKNAFAYNMPKDDLSQLDKYLTQAQDIYNESSLRHNIAVTRTALSNTEGSYYKQLSDLYSEGQLKDMFSIQNSSRGVDNLPYTQINKQVSFRWDKVTDTETELKKIAPYLDDMFPGKKIVRGETTDFTGDIWTISKQDQFTPGELSKNILDVLEGKLTGAKYNLSREIPDIMGQGDMKIVTNDLTDHLKRWGFDKETSSVRMSQGSPNEYTWSMPNGNISLTRRATEDGKYEWKAYTMGFEQGSGMGGNWYQGVFDWIHSLGPQHSYSASSGLTFVNQYRSSIQQLKASMRLGTMSNNINPNTVQVGMSGVPTDRAGLAEGGRETFDTLAKNVVSHLESWISPEFKLAEATDAQLAQIVKQFREGGERQRSTGIETLKMIRAISRHMGGDISQGAKNNFVTKAEALIDELPQPLVPNPNAVPDNSLISRLRNASGIREVNPILNQAEESGLISRAESLKLREQWEEGAL